MKLIGSALGKVIIAISVILIVLVFIGTIFVPKVKEFALGSVPAETNYMVNGTNSDLFTLSCTEDVYEMLVGDTVDIFADITALSSENYDIVPVLEADYAKPMILRNHVFIYKINEDGSAVLSEDIDPSVVGEWAVIYVVNDGADRSALKVNYVFLN